MEKKHILKKYNSVIDGKKNHSMSLLARNLMNILLYQRQRENKNTFIVPLVFLKKELRLSTKDYKDRIERALFELSIPMELRNFSYEGREISFVPASFLIEPTIYKEHINHVEIKISDKFIAAIEEKIGFTILNILDLLKLKTKFSHELAQLVFRYKDLPRNVGENIGYVKKSIDELNYLFGTAYKFPSDIIKKLNQAQKELNETLNLNVSINYSKEDKKFSIYWQREDNYQICIFPKERLRELAQWIADHYTAKTGKEIEDRAKFINQCIQKIKSGEWSDAESSYRGMLQHKYGLIPDTYFDPQKNRYLDFKDRK